MIIVDTDVVSELMKPSPDPAVRAWVRQHGGGELCTTSVTLAEIRYGIERLPDGRRRDELRTVADDVFAAFDDVARATQASPRGTSRTSGTPASP